MRSSRAAWLLLVPIVALGFVLRAWNLDYGLPQIEHPDEARSVVPALRMAHPERLSLAPDHHRYPWLSVYTLSAALYARGALAGGSFTHPALPPAPEALRQARWLQVGFGVATLVAVYGLGAAYRAPGVGLLAALYLAVTPLHALQSHYVNVDVQLTFWVTIALFFAARCLDGGRRRDLLLAAVAVGLAGASKYPGLLMAPILPVIVWKATPREERSWRHFAGTTAMAGSVCAIAFLVATPYTLLRFADTWEAVGAERAHVYRRHFGWDLNVDGWQYHPVVYPLFVGLPFALGAPLYASALAGGVVEYLKRERSRLLVLAAGVGPIALTVFVARVVFPRYLLPLLPAAALMAALGTWTLWRSGRRGARALAATWALLVVAHTGLFTSSLVSRLSPQMASEASAWIRTHVAPGSEITVASGRWTLSLPKGRYRLRRFLLQDLGRPEELSDWMVVSSWTSRAWERGHLADDAVHAFFSELGTAGSAYELAASFTTEYLHEPLYGKLDPQLRNQFESPDVRVYRRRARAAK